MSRHIRAAITTYRSPAAICALTAGWTLVFADDIRAIPLTIPESLHDDLTALLTVATIILGVAMLIRERLLYAAMKLGRQLEVDGLLLGRHRPEMNVNQRRPASVRAGS